MGIAGQSEGVGFRMAAINGRLEVVPDALEKHVPNPAVAWRGT
jgi:hypothetical protein